MYILKVSSFFLKNKNCTPHSYTVGHMYTLLSISYNSIFNFLCFDTLIW